MITDRYKSTGWRRLLAAFMNSFKGLRDGWREEEAFRLEVIMGVFVIPAGLLLGNGPLEKIALIAPMLLVFIIELLNSAIEAAIDRISEDHHPLSGLAKDLGSAAVFVGYVLLALCWGIVFWARL